MTLQDDLRAKISSFEDVLRVPVPSQPTGAPAARALQELYATWGAYALFSSIAGSFPDEVEHVRHLPSSVGQIQMPPTLPRADVIHNAAPALFDAIASGDRSGMVKVLEEMGIFSLCPPLDQMFDRLESRAGCVIGQTRLVVLIELAIFAAEVEAYERANKYVKEADALFPGPSELHDLYAIKGMIALAVGNKGEAIKHLSESIRACEKDDFARVTCAARAPNLKLAEGLLGHSERKVVVVYLAQCKRVWLYLAKQIDSWIDAIQNGKGPESLRPFGILCALDRPAIKLQSLMIKAPFVGNPMRSSRHERGNDMGSERMLAEYKSRMKAAITGKLENGKN